MKGFAWALALLVLLAGTPVISAQSGGARCQFKLGFATLHDALPSVVGGCLDDEAYAANGDSLQDTTGGLLAWRKADNVAAFTNGAHTWVNGPNGLQERLNSERFPFEHDQLGPPDLKLRLLDSFGPLLYCDPDFCPVARADEQSLALARFPQNSGRPAYLPRDPVPRAPRPGSPDRCSEADGVPRLQAAERAAAPTAAG